MFCEAAGKVVLEHLETSHLLIIAAVIDSLRHWCSDRYIHQVVGIVFQYNDPGLVRVDL